MIIAERVGKTFGYHRVLQDISLCLAEGSVTALVGGNGAGKSTLLRILSGSEPASLGQVRANDAQEPICSVARARALGIWMADQEGALIPAWTVEEHFRRLAGVAGEARWRGIVPQVRGADHVRDLSQLERQLIEIALVAEGGSCAALFDEPTAGLSGREKRHVLDILRETAARGSAVICVTHDLDAALSVADRIVALRTGQVILDAPAATLSKQQLLSTYAASEAIDAPVRDQPPPATGKAVTIALDEDATDKIVLCQGEIVGIVSSAHSRARDILRAAAGLISRHPFQIAFDTPVDCRRIGYMGRERSADWDFSGKSLLFNLTAGAWPGLTRFGFVDSLREQDLAKTLLQRFSVQAQGLDVAIDHLSGGNRQKALLARLVSMNPSILLLDEPFSGVDPPTRAVLLAELRRLAIDGVAVAIYSRDAEELGKAVDRMVVVCDDGRLVNLASPFGSAASIEALLDGGRTLDLPLVLP